MGADHRTVISSSAGLQNNSKEIQTPPFTSEMYYFNTIPDNLQLIDYFTVGDLTTNMDLFLSCSAFSLWIEKKILAD